MYCTQNKFQAFYLYMSEMFCVSIAALVSVLNKPNQSDSDVKW